MRLPIVDLFAQRDLTALKERQSQQSAEPRQLLDGAYFEKLFTASQEFRSARLIWASSIGTNLHKLMQHITELHDWGAKIRCISMSHDFDTPFSIDRTPAAWKKICEKWIVPPELTAEEVTEIESTAERIYAFMIAPEVTDDRNSH